MVSLELEARLDNLLSTAQEETADIDIFSPIQEREECPLCLIPLPIEGSKSLFYACCGKRICLGCVHKHAKTEMQKSNGKPGAYKCAFCQQSAVLTQKNNTKCLRRLMKKNCPDAFRQMANMYRDGNGVLQSETRSLEMYIRAAELGDASAYGWIGEHYHEGHIVEQDESKAIEFWVVAAKKGSVISHQELARFHGKSGNIDESIKHSKVVASAGDQEAMDNLMAAYKDKLLPKEELTQTLRAFQASSNAVKSKDRENARLLDEARERGEDLYWYQKRI